MRINELQIKDFLSIGEVFISFPRTGLMLLDGWNEDTQSANGAGKSSLLSAISWCLFGKLPRDITATSITRIGQKSTLVSLKIDLLNGEVLTVTRKRPGGLEVVCEDSLTVMSQEELECKIGLTYERYLNIAYFAQGLGSRFIDLSDTDRKQLFLDLSKSSSYLTAKEKIDLEIKSLSKEIQDLKLEHTGICSRISEIQDAILDANPLLEEIAQIQKQIDDIEDKISSINIQAPDISKFKDLKVRLKQELSSVMEAKAELKVLHNNLRKLQAPREQIVPVECPHCSGSLLIDDDGLKPCDKRAIVEAQEARNQLVKSQQDELKLKIAEVDRIVSKETKIIETIEKCDEKISDLSAEYRNSKNVLENLSSQSSLLSSKRSHIESQVRNIEKTKSRLHELRSKETVVASLLTEKETRVSVLQAASHALGPSGIQAYVLDSIVDEFNSKINELISSGWSNFTYELLTFKEGKAGSISTRFSDSVSIDGQQRSIGSLSGGERRCLSLVIDIALSRIFSVHAGFLPSPIILDEPFDHLDSVNRERAILLVQELASDCCVVVVDHQNETKGMFEHTIEIVKQSGVSSARIVSSNGG